VAEVSEDVHQIQQTLQELEATAHLDPAQFLTLQRLAHKVRGSSAVVECASLSTIAYYMEVISEQTVDGFVFPVLAVHALAIALQALERTLHTFIGTGEEDAAPLQELETTLATQNLDLQQLLAAHEISHNQPAADLEEQSANAHLSRPAQIRIQEVIESARHVTELQSSLEYAQEQVRLTQQQLQEQCIQLGEFQSLLMTSFTQYAQGSMRSLDTSSSLISRLLQKQYEANEKLRAKNRRAGAESQWDELDLERYSDLDLQAHSFNETISQVLASSQQMEQVVSRLQQITQHYLSHVQQLQQASLHLNLAPLDTLIDRLQQLVKATARSQFSFEGQPVEIDAHILGQLSGPLIQVVQAALGRRGTRSKKIQKVLLRAHEAGEEITLTLGFSQSIYAGVIELLRQPLQRLNGRYEIQQDTGEQRIIMHFPRTLLTTPCLLVRVGSQQVLIPFVQIQHILETPPRECDILYQLADLLGVSAPGTTSKRVLPLLLLPRGAASTTTVGIEVDEVIRDLSCVVKPLPAFLQRPGLEGTAVDGVGTILLVLNLPELIRHYTAMSNQSGSLRGNKQNGNEPTKILIADDSASFRQALARTLKHAKYTVLEASDGVEAFDMLWAQMPTLLLLDIEMPHLNGYDLLSLMSAYPELAHLKIIMLTSRSSPKHIQRARELGAHAYLTKPCSQEQLLQTVQSLLQ
jgi:chemosensory pili system protein ChpA (sensor histidine kinase/response regulator)